MKAFNYAFVLDSRGVILSPMKEEKAWYKLRRGSVKLVTVNPLTVQLLREQDNTDSSKLHIGIDPGLTTGIVIVQEGKMRNKIVFKGELQHRRDVSKLITEKACYKRLRKKEKRYREARFNNRKASKRVGRLAPSVKHHKDEILRILRILSRKVVFDICIYEDVLFDTRVLVDGFIPYKWMYQVSNRLDENLRKACLMRDNFKCFKCGLQNNELHVHHIIPKRLSGEDTIKNLITLCKKCHEKVTGNELEYADVFYMYTEGSYIGLKYASQVMIGKNYIKNELFKLFEVVKFTTGGDTSNKRIEMGLIKSHVNDGVAMIGLNIDVESRMYEIKPQRKKRKVKVDRNLEIVQGDLVKYKRKGKDVLIGRVTAIRKTGSLAGRYMMRECRTGKKYGPIVKGSIEKIRNRQSVEFFGL